LGLTGNPQKIFDRNPYRTQICFMAGTSNSSPNGINIAHTQDDIINFHLVMTLWCMGPGVGPPPVVPPQKPVILSFPVHGPMVGEEWWCQGIIGCNLDVTGYLYSD
jgi:hypothetical protein